MGPPHPHSQLAKALWIIKARWILMQHKTLSMASNTYLNRVTHPLLSSRLNSVVSASFKFVIEASLVKVLGWVCFLFFFFHIMQLPRGHFLSPFFNGALPLRIQFCKVNFWQMQFYVFLCILCILCISCFTIYIYFFKCIKNVMPVKLWPRDWSKTVSWCRGALCQIIQWHFRSYVLTDLNLVIKR